MTLADSPLGERLAAHISGSNIALTLADGQAFDHPLVAANQAFLDLTKYDLEFCIGRNCRFLQGSHGPGPGASASGRFSTRRS